MSVPVAAVDADGGCGFGTRTPGERVSGVVKHEEGKARAVFYEAAGAVGVPFVLGLGRAEDGV